MAQSLSRAPNATLLRSLLQFGKPSSISRSSAGLAEQAGFRKLNCRNGNGLIVAATSKTTHNVDTRTKGNISQTLSSPAPSSKASSRRRYSSVLNSSTQVYDVELEDMAEAVLSLAEELAHEAGEMIVRTAGKATQVEAKEARSDLVTEVDKACEELIHKSVSDTFPLHRWIGEETVTDADLERLGGHLAENEWTWIVDPIDGTLNFIGGIPMCAVSIGVARGNAMEVGVVYDPFHNELFSARRGQGAWLNGQPLRVLDDATELEDAVVSLGYPSKPEVRAQMLQAACAVAPHCRTLRAFGSAALHISYVAAGRLGCFFEHGLKAWDVAAARLILQEAGGKVTDFEGNPLPLRAGSVLASSGSPLIHQRVIDLIRT